MKFTLDVCLSENSTPNLKVFQSGLRAQLWQRNSARARTAASTFRTHIRRVRVKYIRLQPVTLHPSYNTEIILTLSAKAPSLLPLKRSHTYLWNNKARWALVAWRLYRYHFIQINILSTPHISNLANYFTFEVRNFIRKRGHKLPMMRRSTTFQTCNL